MEKKEKLYEEKQDVSWEEMPNRKIVANIPDPKIPNNKIGINNFLIYYKKETSKYNCITFIPKNLLEQFSKMANLYFLIVGFLAMIKEISTSAGKPVIFIPLIAIVIITAIKDAFEDFKRKSSDSEENNRKVQILRKGKFEKIKWERLRVGDIIKIYEDEYFPADVLLLKSSDSKGMGYIETKNLDGETNLKHKKVNPDMMWIGELSDEEYEKPNPYLYTFSGVFSKNYNSDRCALDANNFILRGCSLRNTKHIYGMVGYTGHDTKIMLNSVPARAKTSQMMRLMNSQIVSIFIVQIVVCLACGLYAAIWYEIEKDNVNYFDIKKDDIKDNNFAYNFFVRFGNWLMMFVNFVPISMLVTLEMVKFLQGIMITRDPKLISKETNTPTMELGQIDYIFSDKTGTLTCNLMEFKMLNVFGNSYGDNRDLPPEEFNKKKVVTNVDFKDLNFFNDLENELSENHEKICDTLLHLALCHTIITEEKNGELAYNASSPDELALVNLAKFTGCEFAGFDENNNMLVNFKNKILKYKLLNVLEFNSSRKRMSVIVRDPNDKIILFCKGADTILQPRIKLTNDEIFQQTRTYLEKYACVGLRTLLLAKKEIDEATYSEWNVRFREASSSLENKEKKVDAVEEEIEMDMEIVGATAIEDKLQDEVGKTISSLKRAGIKVWVLTGDKVETAINIGYSCELLDDTLGKIIIDGTGESEVQESIDLAFKGIQQAKLKNLKFALILTGNALIYAMKNDQMKLDIVEIADNCESVIACRVSPMQKEEIVSLVKNNKPDKITLAIGDGANDVNMITAAHVGIGIKGVEGQQAARASDYVMGEFKFLARLLLYRGRECYRRNGNLICYNFFKNLVLVFPQFWFGFFSGFSGTTIYDPYIYQLFNVFYASLPIVIYALIDKEYRGRHLCANPQLYVDGRLGSSFNRKVFWFWFMSGLIQSFFISIPIYFIIDSLAGTQFLHVYDGHTSFVHLTGNIVFTLIVINSNLKILLFSAFKSPTFYFSVLWCLIPTTFMDFAHGRYNHFLRVIYHDELNQRATLEMKATLKYKETINEDKKAVRLSEGTDEQEDDIKDLDRDDKKIKVKKFAEMLVRADVLKRFFKRRYTGYAYSQEEPLDDEILKYKN